MPESEQTTLLLVDDDAGFRAIARTVLTRRGNFRVVGEATNGREAIELARRLRPAVCIMDIEMAELDGLSATREIRRAVADTKVLIFSSNTAMMDIERAAAAGAAGFVAKTIPAELPKAARSILRHPDFYLGLDLRAPRGLGDASAAL